MSYLPRLSKTYKEPEQNVTEEMEEITSNLALKPASSLLAEGTHNPQVALKHYRYLPHPLPVLPGPSVFEEVEENELLMETSRLRRSNSKVPNQSKGSEEAFEAIVSERSEAILLDASPEEILEKSLSRPVSKKSVKRSKSSLGQKKSTKSMKREKISEITINTCIVDGSLRSFAAAQDKRDNQEDSFDSGFPIQEEINLAKEKNSDSVASKQNSLVEISRLKPRENPTAASETSKSEVISKEQANCSTQCTIFGSTEKKFVIPHVTHSLLRCLSFLLRELQKEDVLSNVSGERRTLMTQIQLILGDLCGQKIENEYGFDVTYSDSKRLEKIFGDLQKTMKDTYGDKKEYFDKMEDLKKIFIDLRRKELEVDILTNKLKELEEQIQPDLILKESELKNPEITLQNKRLESEQLSAENEFSFRELLNYQKAIAEIDWDIKNSQEKMAGLKKSVSRSKNEVLGRGGSLHKFSTDSAPKRSKSKESDVHFKKKI